MSWLDKLKEKLKAWLRKEYEKQLPKVDPLPKEDKPADKPTTDNPSAVDQDEAKHNFSHTAPITNKITYTRHNASGIYFRNSGLAWADSELVGEAHLMVIRNGKWVGGKIDHVRNNTTSRDWKNVHQHFNAEGKLEKDYYGVFEGIKEPAAGEVCAFFLISYNKAKRTNAIFFDWR